MSKSLGNYICVDEAPEAMYEKVMRIPDDVLVDYYRLTTDLNLNEVSDLMKKESSKYDECVVDLQKMTNFYF